jgi:hypothetical protein
VVAEEGDHEAAVVAASIAEEDHEAAVVAVSIAEEDHEAAVVAVSAAVDHVVVGNIMVAGHKAAADITVIMEATRRVEADREAAADITVIMEAAHRVAEDREAAAIHGAVANTTAIREAIPAAGNRSRTDLRSRISTDNRAMGSTNLTAECPAGIPMPAVTVITAAVRTVSTIRPMDGITAIGTIIGIGPGIMDRSHGFRLASYRAPWCGMPLGTGDIGPTTIRTARK